MSSEVTDLIASLRDGTRTLDEVAQKFRHRSWTRTRRPEPQTYLELAARAQEDPEPDVPGSFDEVVAAYDRGELSRVQYRTLAEAAAESIRAEDPGGSAGDGQAE
ncbi:MAG: hypothetical protein ACLP70_17275 [Streptosporangiaceae bacterium]|jgi:hypothetical protein